MTLKELIEYSDELVPNPFSYAIKTEMVNQIEAEIMHDVFLLSQEDVVQYAWLTDQNTALFLRPPHTDVYKNYMRAMLYRQMGEAARYNNENDLFNESLRTLCRCVAEKIHPSNGRAITSGYYISAYAIAVKHGYEGSEEEWIKSIGSGGAAVDETLLFKGMAADAEVVGRKFEELKNGKGRVSVAEAASKQFVVTDTINGVYFMCETRDTAEPSVAFYGESGDEPVLLQNVAEPKAARDASNKGYVDKTFSKAPRIFRAGDDLTGAKDGDFLMDDEEDEDEDEPEMDDDDFVTAGEMKDYVAEAISAALGKIGYAEEVAY